MNDLGALSRQLCELLQSPGEPREGGPALRCALDSGQWVGGHFQQWQQRWLLGVGCATQQLETGTRARLEEALLRVGHASRWGRQQAGLGESQEVELVDCDFRGAHAALTAAAVQDQLQALSARLDALAAGRPAGAPQAQGGWHARACGCARAFSARVRTLDASRPTGSIAPLELLFDDHLPLRIALHPRSHHWVFEAFVWDAGGLAVPLRRALVSTLLHINAAVLGGRALVCSLDALDRVVVISRWHPDWAAPGRAAPAPVLDWLDYSLRQARRIGGVCAAIALHAAPSYSDTGSEA